MAPRHRFKPPYAMIELELSRPFTPIVLEPLVTGAHVLVRHRDRPVGRFWLERRRHGRCIEAARVRALALEAAERTSHVLALRRDLGAPGPGRAPAVSLSVAVCTRNRPVPLRRCLAALVEARDRWTANLVELLVVDNAPDDASTQEVAASFARVRHVVEPVPGLNFGRNRALAATESDYLAFVDDDAVVDRAWMASLFEAIAVSPLAGAFTGPVLPLSLETEAQVRFERAGGFGPGIELAFMDGRRFADPIHPASAGRLGTGANMAFRVEALNALGGFDEALDTGPPLPGGGDLDILHRLVRSGWRLVYSPGQVVHHEHRRDMAGLRRQYYSWGLSIMAQASKSWAGDPTMRRQVRAMLRWYLLRRAREIPRAVLGRTPRTLPFILADLRGAFRGLAGEYSRSQRRMAARKRRFAG